MVNKECVEQLLDLLALKDQLIQNLHVEISTLKEDLPKTLSQELTQKQKTIIQQEEEILAQNQALGDKEIELSNKDEEIRRYNQQITTLTEQLTELNNKYLAEVDVSTQFIDQLGKDIEKKEKLIREEYVPKSRYEEVFVESSKRKAKIKELQRLLLDAEDDASHSRSLLEFKAQEYNTSFTELKEATLGQLESFEMACEQTSLLQDEVKRLKHLLGQKEKEAQQAQQQAQAIERSMSQLKVKYEQELYITKQMLKTETSRKLR